MLKLSIRVILALLMCLATLSQAGCGPEVVRTESVGEPVVSTSTLSCHKTAFCYVCGIGFDGKFNCGAKLSPMCPGKKEAKISTTTVKVYYADNSVRERQDVNVLSAGPCK